MRESLRFLWLMQTLSTFTIPTAKTPAFNCAQHATYNLLRWALNFRSLRCDIEHVAGEGNVWPDMMTRWAATLKSVTEVKSLHVLQVFPVSPLTLTDLDWPCSSDMLNSQTNAKEKIQSTF